jgi:hypothetical protein
VELEKQGKASADQVSEARTKAAGAMALYRDAATAAAERRVVAEQRQAQAEQAAIGVEMERAKAAA